MAKKGAKTEKKNEDIVNIIPEATTVEEIQQEIKEKLESDAKEVLETIENDIETTETEFNDVVSAVTEKITDEVRKKDEFLKNFESEIPTKSEEELKETLIKEIQRIDDAIKEISSKNNSPLTTYYWNGINVDI